MNKIKLLILIATVSYSLFTSCSSTNTISINSETIIENDAKVDWAITHEDSIVDFRKSKFGYAEIKNDSLVYGTSEDSIKTYQISKFRIIHTFEGAPISTIILGSIVVSFAYLFYSFGGISM